MNPEQFKFFVKFYRQAKESGLLEKPHIQRLFALASSPIASISAVGVTRLYRLEERLGQIELARPWAPLVDFPQEEALFLGNQYYTGAPVWMDRRKLGQHAIIAGTTSAGKSTAINNIIRQLERWEMEADIIDAKGDQLGLMYIIPYLIVIAPETDPVNDLDEGDLGKKIWLAKAEATSNIRQRPETYLLYPQQLNDIVKHLPEGAPRPSWHDLANIMAYRARKEPRRENYATAARVLSALVFRLGKRGFIRKGIDISKNWKIRLYNLVETDHMTRMFLLGMTLSDLLFKALKVGHSRVPTRLLVIHEGMDLASKAAQNVLDGHVPPAQLLFSMASSTSTGLLLAIQSATATDPVILANCHLKQIFRQGSVTDAEECLNLLGITGSQEWVDELLNLPPGVAYIRMPGWPNAVKTRIPNVEIPHTTQADVLARFQSEYDSWQNEIIYAPETESGWLDKIYYDIVKKQYEKPRKTPEPTVPDSQTFERLDERHVTLLKCMAEIPDGSAEGYRVACGGREGTGRWGANKYNEVRKKLLDDGLIEEHRKGKYRVTEKGLEYLKAI